MWTTFQKAKLLTTKMANHNKLHITFGIGVDVDKSWQWLIWVGAAGVELKIAWYVKHNKYFIEYEQIFNKYCLPTELSFLRGATGNHSDHEAPEAFTNCRWEARRSLPRSPSAPPNATVHQVSLQCETHAYTGLYNVHCFVKQFLKLKDFHKHMSKRQRTSL